MQGGYGPEHVNVEAQRRDPDSLLHFVSLLVRRYREAPELGWGDFEVLDQPHRAVLAHRLSLDGRPPSPSTTSGPSACMVPLRLRDERRHPLVDQLCDGTVDARREGQGRGRPRGLRLPLAPGRSSQETGGWSDPSPEHRNTGACGRATNCGSDGREVPDRVPKKWDLGVLVGSLVTARARASAGSSCCTASGNAAGSTTNLFVILLGIVTFAFFAGPGLVYVLRKRVKKIKDLLPGGTMTWIRSHLYLPVLALVAAYAHAQRVPFRSTLTSGKVLLVLGILVSVAGMARHHLIGMQKAALNVNVAVGKLTTGQPRPFRRLVADYTDHKRTREEVDAPWRQFDPALQERWKQDHRDLRRGREALPPEGRPEVAHPPVQALAGAPPAAHHRPVPGAGVPRLGRARRHPGRRRRGRTSSPPPPSAPTATGPIFDEWASSTMSHAATSTINEGQLPITLSENGRIIDEFDGSDSLALLTGRDLDEDSQEDLVLDNAQVCIDCHMPIGGSFTEDPLALLPFGEGDSEVSGNAGRSADGVGCVVCHTRTSPPAEIQGAAALGGDGHRTVRSPPAAAYGTMFGPIFEDPNPLPVRIHDIETPGDETTRGSGATTSRPASSAAPATTSSSTSTATASATTTTPRSRASSRSSRPSRTTAPALDADGDFILDENELDDDRIQTEGGVAVDDDGDAIEVVGGGIVLMAAWRGRDRRDADHRNAAARAGKPVHGVQMVVPVQHQLGAVRCDELQERRGVGEPLVARAKPRPHPGSGELDRADYFATLGIPLLHGRDFTRADAVGAPGVVVINETMANQFWPGQDALGKRFKFFGDQDFTTVIGIAKNSKYNGVAEDPIPSSTSRSGRTTRRQAMLHVRAEGDAAGLAPAVRREVREIDPTLSVFNVRTLEEQVSQSLAADAHQRDHARRVRRSWRCCWPRSGSTASRATR